MKIFITGGAGFIGSNCAQYFAKEKKNNVVLFDNLSRTGSSINIEWLRSQYPLVFVKGDVRNFREVENVARTYGPFDLILHLAAQVAVTRSVENPRLDFETNALGSFNVLEMTRKYCPDAVFIYSSTNKVYGSLARQNIIGNKLRYNFRGHQKAISESENLEFLSPYGCSKGAADQYCLDYARIYGLKTVVLRQSCIYGYRQFGVEDQGWVAWFCIAAAKGKPVTLYGNGKQVRDLLFIDDLLVLYKKIYEKISLVAGKAFNVGGGPANTLSLIELIKILQDITGNTLQVKQQKWRVGDQRVFVADISAISGLLKWKPKTGPIQGIKKLYSWVSKNMELFD